MDEHFVVHVYDFSTTSMSVADEVDDAIFISRSTVMTPILTVTFPSMNHVISFIHSPLVQGRKCIVSRHLNDQSKR